MKVNFLESASKFLNIGGKRETHDTVAPTNPQNGDCWWEPGARYPQPWEWDSSNSQWMSQLIPLQFGTVKFIPPMSGNNFNVFPQPIWFYNVAANRVKVVSGNIFLQTFATAHTQGVNFLNFTVRYVLGTGVLTPLYTFPEDTGNNSTAMTANGFRRINANIDLYLPGNAWNIAFVYSVYGSPGECHMTPIFWIRMARP